MGRRSISLVLALLLVISTVIAIGAPFGALAATNYNSCPSFSTFQSDVQAFSGTGTITFSVANCTITATSTITVANQADVTINGNGLSLLGGTSGSHGAFALFTLGRKSNLTLDHTTLSYALIGVSQSQAKDGDIVLTDSTVSDNSVDGINQSDGTTNKGSITLDSTTVSGNGADGISQNNGDITITNSTISNNVVNGVAQSSGTITITSSTVTGNLFGINQDSGSQTNFQATLLAQNSTQNCAVPTVNDKRYNLSDDDSCGFSNTGSLNNVSDADLNLGTLGDYGGPTQTVPLLHQSVALNAIPTDPNNECRVGTLVDQRGVARPQRNKCDIGAYELLIPDVTAQNANASATDASVTLNATVTTSCDPNGTYCPVVDDGKMTFSITDSNDNPVGVDKTKDKVDNGGASVDFSLAGIPAGTYTITARYHDGPALFGNGSGTATLTIAPGPSDQITLDPGDTNASTGTSVTETATVKDQYGNLVVDGTTVDFVVTGPNATSGSSTTTNGQASFMYTGAFTGSDTLVATAEDGSNPSASATIDWTAPTSTSRSTLTILNLFPTSVRVVVSTGFGNTPRGSLTYRDRSVNLTNVQLQSLVVNGSTATLIGTANANGAPVSFILTATMNGRTIDLQLSNGYDSGPQSVWILFVH